MTGVNDWTGRSVSYVSTQFVGLNSVMNAEGGVTRYDYNAVGQLSSITDPRNLTTTFTYDGFGRVFTLTQADGSQWTFLYGRQAVDQMTYCNTSSPDPLLSPAVTDATYVIDPRSTNRPASPTAGWASFDFVGSAYCHDSSGRVLRTARRDARAADPNTSLDSGAVDVTYDANGYPSTIGWGVSTRTQYWSVDGKLTSVYSAAGTSNLIDYTDGRHFPTGVTNAQGFRSGFIWDAAGNLKTATEPTGNTLTYGYNPDGTVATATEQLNNTTVYSYTGGDLTTIDPPGTAIGDSTFTYDSLSRLKTARDGEGQVTTLSYDNLDRITRIDSADGTFISVTYDADGNAVRRQEGSGATVTKTSSYGYDAMNRGCYEYPGEYVTSCADAPIGSIKYGYDGLGRLTSYTDAAGTVSYGYGMGGRLNSIVDPYGAQTTLAVSDGTVPDHHPTTPPTITYPNGVTVTNTSDKGDRLVRTKAVNAAGAVLMDLGYDYRTEAVDETQQGMETDLIRTKSDYLTGRVTYYGYDATGRLTSAYEYGAGGIANSWTYGYDAAGNRISKNESSSTSETYTYNQVNQMISAGATTFGYDANGSRTSSSGGFAATYNAKNQTTTLKGAGGRTTNAATYDGAGQSQLTDFGATSYRNTALGISSVGEKAIVRRPGGELVSIRSDGNTYYPLQDLLGSVVGVTDPSGNKVASLDYSPYGQTTASSGDTSISPFQFHGQLSFPGQNSLYKMGERWYDPELGGWTQQDPLPVGNRYAFADSNPVNNTDPSGLFSLCNAASYAGGTLAGSAVGLTVTPPLIAAGGTVGGPPGAAAGFAAGSAAGAGAGFGTQAAIQSLCSGSKDEGDGGFSLPIPPLKPKQQLYPPIPELKDIQEMAFHPGEATRTAGDLADGRLVSGGNVGGWIPGCA